MILRIFARTRASSRPGIGLSLHLIKECFSGLLIRFSALNRLISRRNYFILENYDILFALHLISVGWIAFIHIVTWVFLYLMYIHWLISQFFPPILYWVVYMFSLFCHISYKLVVLWPFTWLTLYLGPRIVVVYFTWIFFIFFSFSFAFEFYIFIFFTDRVVLW